MDVRAQQIAAVLRIEQLAAPAPVTAAFGTTTRAAVGIIMNSTARSPSSRPNCDTF